jgi:hypothetical protein
MEILLNMSPLAVCTKKTRISGSVFRPSLFRGVFAQRRGLGVARTGPRWALLHPTYLRVGRLITIDRDRKVMNATCISTIGSEAFWEGCFTLFILDPFQDIGECTEGNFVVQ